MTVDSAADRAVFLSTDAFGAAVTWTRDGTPSTLNGILDRPSLLVEESGAALIDRDASLLVLEADLPAGAAEGDPVAVAGESQSWLCQAIRPRGDGFAVVDLRRA